MATSIKALKEIQEYRTLGTIEELKELKKKSEWIHCDISSSLYEKEIFDKIEKALGFKLFVWQKTYITTGIYRRSGKTVAECLRQLLTTTQPIDYTTRPKSKVEAFHRETMVEMKQKLEKVGLHTTPIFFNEKDKRQYSMEGGYEESKWIRCSERLPNNAECAKNDCRFIVTDGSRVYQRHFDYSTHRFCEPMVGNTFNTFYDKKVIAWQQLPERLKIQEGGFVEKGYITERVD